MSEINDTVDDLWGPLPTDNDPTDGQLGGTPSEGRVVLGDASEGTNHDRTDSLAPSAGTGNASDDVDNAVKRWKAGRTLADYQRQARAMLTPTGVPASLQATPRWLLWRFDENGQDKPRKVPLRLDGRFGSSTDPTAWASFDAVVAAYKAGTGGADGIGFVFTEDDDIVGVDLDGCRDPVTGAIAPWGRADLDALGSWAEVSCTGTGVHVFARGRLASGVKNRSGQREVYATGRYFTVTGQTLDGAPLEVMDLPHLTDWHADRFPKQGAPVREVSPPAAATRDATRDKPSKRPDKVARARAYAGNMAPAVSGENGHDTAMRCVGAVVRGFDLTVDEARTALAPWNNGCVPPWSDAELAHKIREAQATPDPEGRDRGWLLKVDRPMAGSASAPTWSMDAANDDDTPEAASWRQDMRRAREDLTMAMGTSTAVLSTPCDFISYADLMRKDIPPVRWLVSGLLTDDAVAVVAGEPKTAKTWLALEIAVAVALGDKVMGEFQARRTGPVVLFLTEDREASVKARLSSTVLGHAVDPLEAAPPIHIKSRGTLDLSDVATLAWLVASVRRLPEPPRLLVIDPLRNVMGALKESDNDDMAKVNAALRALRDVLGATVLYVHHTGKLTEGNAGRRAGQRMRGGSALHGGYDAGIHLSAPTTTQDGRKTVMSATVDVEVKAGKAAAPFSFDLNIHDNDDGQCIRADWAHEGETRAAKAVAEMGDKAAAAILCVFRSKLMNYRMGKSALATMAGGRHATTLKAVDELLSTGKLVGESRGKSLEVWPADCSERCRRTFEGAWWTSGANDVGGRPFVSVQALTSYLATQGGQARGEVEAYLSGKHRRGDLLGELVALGFIKAHEPGDAPDDEPGWVIVDPEATADLMARAAEIPDRLASG